MIDYLIEIIFSNVSAKKIGKLLKDFTSEGSEVVNYNLTSGDCKIDWKNEQSIEAVFQEYKSFGLFINLKKLNKAGVCLRNCGISIYKCEFKINIEINFQLLDQSSSYGQLLTKNLMELAKSIAVQYEIKGYYCGLEPAEETETRLFTNQQVGPFSIQNE